MSVTVTSVPVSEWLTQSVKTSYSIFVAFKISCGPLIAYGSSKGSSGLSEVTGRVSGKRRWSVKADNTQDLQPEATGSTRNVSFLFLASSDLNQKVRGAHHLPFRKRAVGWGMLFLLEYFSYHSYWSVYPFKVGVSNVLAEVSRWAFSLFTKENLVRGCMQCTLVAVKKIYYLSFGIVDYHPLAHYPAAVHLQCVSSTMCVIFEWLSPITPQRYIYNVCHLWVNEYQFRL